MARQVVVECRRPTSGFDSERYARDDDSFANAIVVPPWVFDELGAEPYSYVEATSLVDDHDEASATVYALPFDAENGPDEPVAAVRTNLMQKIHPELEKESQLALRPIDTPRVGPLDIYRSYSDQQSHGCYIHPAKLDALGKSAGDRVELFDPVTGGRAITQAQELYAGDHDTEEMIRLGLPLVNVLNVGFGDQVCVRSPVDTSVSPSDPWSRADAVVNRAAAGLLGVLVGSREVQLKVERGENQDEQREIARMSESTRQYIGVEINDKIRIEWKNRTRTAQCLPPRDDDTANDPVSVEPLEVAIPSSLRDAIEVSPDDTVNVQRDTWFVFRKQVSISIIGILGVVFGTFQVMNATGWIDVLVGQFGRTIALIQLLALAGVISLPVLFLIFLPVRGDV